MQQSRNLSQQNLTTLLQAVADHGQADIGLAAGRDKSWVSRFIHGEQKVDLQELLKILEATGLMLVREDQELVPVPREEHDALVTFAQKGILSYKRTGAL